MPVAVSDSCFRISFGAGHRACLGGNSLTAVSLLWFAPIGRTCDCLERVAEISVYIIAHFRVEIRGHEENSPDRSGDCLITLLLVEMKNRRVISFRWELPLSIIRRSEYDDVGLTQDSWET